MVSAKEVAAGVRFGVRYSRNALELFFLSILAKLANFQIFQSGRGLPHSQFGVRNSRNALEYFV
jgi:hypothetical protein